MTHNIPEFELVHHHDIFVDELQKFQQFIAKQCNIADALILKLISSGQKKKEAGAKLHPIAAPCFSIRFIYSFTNIYTGYEHQ